MAAKLWLAYLWECGDEWCNCSQAFIQKHHPLCKHKTYDGREAHRYDPHAAPIWESDFVTDGDGAAYDQLVETMRAMKEHWPEAFETVIDMTGVTDDR